MRRAEALDKVAAILAALRSTHPTRVAIDGVDAAGKTTLADELAERVRAGGRTVIRASIDGFHRPRAERIRRGGTSPEGFYRDSFDHPALVSALLAPLGPGGDRRFSRAVFDFRSDTAVGSAIEEADPQALLIFEGIFLQRPELDQHWDYRIFVEASFATTVARAKMRDRHLFGSEDEVAARYAARYVPGQRLYLAEVAPRERAQLVFVNDDTEHPEILVSAPPGCASVTSAAGAPEDLVPDITIRKATTADAAVLSRLMIALGYESSPEVMSVRQAAIAADGACETFVAEADGAIHGVAGLRTRSEIAWHKDKLREGEVVVLVVAESGRGKGVGTALLRAAEDFFRQRGVEEVTISCGSQRTDSHRFYRNRGYAESVWVTLPGAAEGAAGKRLSVIFKKRL